LTGAIFCGANGLLVIGEQSVSSGLAAVVIASVPLWGALFAGATGRWPSPREWAGLAAGFAGMILLNFGADLRASPMGGLALLASAATWALSSTWSRRLQLPQGLMLPAAQMLGGGAVLLLLALLGGQRPAQVPSPRALVALLYLIAA